MAGRSAVRTLGVIGDVHAERVRLAAVLDHFSTLGLDRIVCTGDLPDGPGSAADVDACCALLQQADVLTIAGNHDRWLLDGEMRDLPGATSIDDLAQASLAFLRALPHTAELTVPDGIALLCHGLDQDDMAEVLPFDHGRALADNAPLQALLRGRRYRYLINGHTHRAMVRAIDGLTIINPGTLLRDHGSCCAVLDFSERTVRFFSVSQDGNITEDDTQEL
jgi:predicted phosphodiesterase